MAQLTWKWMRGVPRIVMAPFLSAWKPCQQKKNKTGDRFFEFFFECLSRHTTSSHHAFLFFFLFLSFLDVCKAKVRLATEAK